MRTLLQEWKARLRYRLDDLFARSSVSQFLLLVLLSVIVVLIGMTTWFFGLFAPENDGVEGIGDRIDRGPVDALWWSLKHLIDPGVFGEGVQMLTPGHAESLSLLSHQVEDEDALGGRLHHCGRQHLDQVLRLDPRRTIVTGRQVIARDPGHIFQMGEPVRFPNGEVAVYFDVQTVGHDGRHYRNGMRFARSSDAGQTFGAWEELGLVDGVEYGF